MPDDRELLLEMRGRVAWLTLNRPERRNALSSTLLESLAEAVQELSAGGQARCAVLRGAGGEAFSAGMDLKDFSSGGIADIEAKIGPGGMLPRLLDTMEESPVPFIAMIDGWCLGAACEMSMACDLRVGSEGCRMGMPPARLGIVYPAGGLQRFLRAIGPAQARKVFLTARYFDAREALSMGMLHYLVPGEELVDFSTKLAGDVATRAPLAVAGLKRSLYHLTRSLPPSAEAELEMEILAKDALRSRDAAEALEAFAHKRDPEFHGE